MPAPEDLEKKIDLYKRTVRDLRELLGLDWKTIRKEIDICPACGSDLKKK